MFEDNLKKLTLWRNRVALEEKVDYFRVLPNKTLEELARENPKSKEEMLQIKGIKDAKFRRYGKEILKILSSEQKDEDDNSFYEIKKPKTITVSKFLDIINETFLRLNFRIKGEISSIDFREKIIYFSIKDKTDGSLVNCFIFRYQYNILAVKLEEGMEVILEGFPEIYKPYGKFSLKVNSIEFYGEGELKKEYERLKKKLTEKGFFEEAGKRKFIKNPEKIGLITSRDGAAIGDFVSNIGKFGLKIRFLNSSVEGKRALFELIEAIKFFQKSDIDTLVIIRGGGSLESLQAFNSESLINEVKKIKVPVICGVGHEKDVSLLSLASDYSVSTPTAAARLIGSIWEDEIERINYLEREIFYKMQSQFIHSDKLLRENSFLIESGFNNLITKIQNIFKDFVKDGFGTLEFCVDNTANILENKKLSLLDNFRHEIGIAGERLIKIGREIDINNPERQLRMGYGIVSKANQSVKSIEELKENDDLKIRLIDGEIESRIKKIS